ncbi:GDSL-type esterase/lipase family protein [Streptomyces oceani]|uniref:SGNH hydrolase-type esterase domain-containing protein n=1 Tax=Streptomyces oceani TaxID=1075402 RepID=A0A1E7KME6_9ACTN|nr:GDSL-type esterase/lipase family protein [Streptomyces oceani]OEV05077.1 hypothetical protein AN216_04455 [Streptomyces oceani]
MRIMFVGDSMTVGSAGDVTWRYRMWQRLERDPRCGPYTIVGPHDSLHEGSHAYAAPDFPAHARRHLADWGAGWTHLAPAIGDAVRQTRADTLLVSLGLIDLGFYTDVPQTLENVRHFLSEARAANPRTRLVLLPVLPNVRARTDPRFAAACAEFNAALVRLVDARQTADSPLRLAAAPPNWTASRDTYDGTHPGPRGERRIATAFADALLGGWGRRAPGENAGEPRSLVPPPAVPDPVGTVPVPAAR